MPLDKDALGPGATGVGELDARPPIRPFGGLEDPHLGDDRPVEMRAHDGAEQVSGELTGAIRQAWHLPILPRPAQGVQTPEHARTPGPT